MGIGQCRDTIDLVLEKCMSISTGTMRRGTCRKVFAVCEAHDGKNKIITPQTTIAVPSSVTAMSIRGYALLTGSVLFYLFGIYCVVLGEFAPGTGRTTRPPSSYQPAFAGLITTAPKHRRMDALALQLDAYYQYLVLFLVPVTAYFAIANWVGWQYYRNS